MYIDSSILKLILSYAFCVCIFFMWYWSFIFFAIKRNGKEDLESYTLFNKILLKSTLFILTVPCIFLFIINIINSQWIDDLWDSIEDYIAHDSIKLLLIFALSVALSFGVCSKFCLEPGMHPFRNGEWKKYLSFVYLLTPICFLFAVLILNFNLITFVIIIGIIGLILSGKIIGL